MSFQTALGSIDSYKLGHAEQYPEGTTKVYSNFTPRSDAHLKLPSEYKDGKIVWFGLQGFLYELNEIWGQTFFRQSKPWLLNNFVEMITPFVGPNKFNIQRFQELHNLGYLPLEIKALPEGSRVNIGVPCLTITNTLPAFYWLPNFLEVWMSAELWKMSTSATISYAYRQIIEGYAKNTGGAMEFIPWQGHDFSTRGMSGIQDAAKSGAGHLLSFMGTDNIPAIEYLNAYYHGKGAFLGGSVPATEHSVMCAGGETSEALTFKRLITETYPSGIVSVVSDTWDLWHMLTYIAPEYKKEILDRKPDAQGMAKVVFRPDSGDPIKIICGDPEAPYQSPAWYGAVALLDRVFGSTKNEQGFRTLNPRVGLIYGDSITPERCDAILRILSLKGYASDNVVFGIGSYTFQYQTRDSLGFAMKATYVEINGVGKAIYKDPITDSGTKKSAKGLLRVEKESNNFRLYDYQSTEEEKLGELSTVYLDGHIVMPQSITTIRNRLHSK